VNADQARAMVPGAALLVRGTEPANWVERTSGGARVAFHDDRVEILPLAVVEFDFGLGDEDMGGECVLCGAPGGYPYCSVACHEADQDDGVTS
jgi:hypothetical protein